MCPIINFFAFTKYQEIDTFKLLRVASNTLIGLDNSSKDNFVNYQVYLKVEQLYKGYDLIVPKGSLSEFRLEKSQFKIIARLNSVIENDYDPNISLSDIPLITAMKNETLPRLGKIPFSFTFITEPTNQNKQICLWRMNDVIYFIPSQAKLNCSKDKK
jgi:hypothetical protein